MRVFEVDAPRRAGRGPTRRGRRWTRSRPSPVTSVTAGRAPGSRTTKVLRPRWMRWPARTGEPAAATRTPSTSMPFAEPRSLIRRPSGVTVSTAWCRETDGSSTRIVADPARPTTWSPGRRGYLRPLSGPPTTSAVNTPACSPRRLEPALSSEPVATTRQPWSRGGSPHLASASRTREPTRSAASSGRPAHSRRDRRTSLSVQPTGPVTSTSTTPGWSGGTTLHLTLITAQSVRRGTDTRDVVHSAGAHLRRPHPGLGG